MCRSYGLTVQDRIAGYVWDRQDFWSRVRKTGLLVTCGIDRTSGHVWDRTSGHVLPLPPLVYMDGEPCMNRDRQLFYVSKSSIGLLLLQYIVLQFRLKRRDIVKLSVRPSV